MRKPAPGFSLIEALITLAIMTVGMLVFAEYLSTMFNQQRILMQKAIAISINLSAVNLMTSAAQHCSGNIKGANIHFPTGVPPASAKIACPIGCPSTKLDYYDSSGTPLATAITTGLQPDGSGIDITSIELIKIASLGPGQYKANMVINYGGQSPVPPAGEVQGILISATTSGGFDTLSSCSPPPPVLTWDFPAWCHTPLPAGCSSAGGSWTWLTIYAAFHQSNLQIETGAGALDGTAPWPMSSSIYPGTACYNGVAWCYK